MLAAMDFRLVNIKVYCNLKFGELTFILVCFFSADSDPVQKQPVSVDALVARMKVLSEKHDECSEAELSNRFKNVEMQVRQ